jgi:hypothetical protein
LSSCHSTNFSSSNVLPVASLPLVALCHGGKSPKSRYGSERSNHSGGLGIFFYSAHFPSHTPSTAPRPHHRSSKPFQLVPRFRAPCQSTRSSFQGMAQVWVRRRHRRSPLLHIRIRLDPQHPTCDHHLSSDGSISRESPDSKSLYAGSTTTTIGRSLFKKIQLV